ncbi:GTPase [Rothia terrae]|nr:GTPase [Rothia terrae]MDT0190347.1 GTPase [Rothia terrae]
MTNPEPLEGQELKDFEKELEAILALDPIERLSRLDQTAEDLREDLR